MRSRTLGNSNASVMRRIEEYHNEGSPKGHLQYLGDYESYRSQRKELRLDVAECRPPPPLQMVASPKWRLATYVRDMYVRLEDLKSKLALVTLIVLSCIGLCKHYKKATRSFLSTGVREVQSLLDSIDIENVFNSDSDS